jgi:hypothetical protein
MKTPTTRTMVVAALAAAAATALSSPAIASADNPPPCADGQVQVSNGGEYARSGHRAVVLNFKLAPGAAACTLTGYPGVDSGEGGPLLHADRTLFGWMGGLKPDQLTDNQLPTLTVSEFQAATALVEGVAADRTDPYHKCPTYSQLLVTPPDASTATTIWISMDTCELQVHPIGTSW